MAYLKYVTKPGDRWDNLAYDAYGDEFAYVNIADANLEVAITDILPGGITIRIPILPIPDTDINTALLPPWKQ
jgi:phage tail protein X